MEHVSYDTWAALVIAPFILAVSLPMIRWITRDDDDPMFGLLGAALVVKLLASLLRYFVAFELYGGRADAARYDLVGEQLANQFIAGSLPLRDLLPLATGTEFLERLTATVYAVAGPTRLGGFLLFSWMSWWGLLLCHRAARVGVPELDHRRYAWLLFFLPSLLFWPSGIGKEAWMLLCIGVAAYGAARILARQPLGYVIAAIGLTGAGVARPHVAAVFMAALLVAAVFRRAPGERPLLGPIGRYLGVAILSVGLAFAFSQVVKYFFPTGDVTGFDAVTGVLDTAQDRTAVGGSEIDTSRPELADRLPARARDQPPAPHGLRRRSWLRRCPGGGRDHLRTRARHRELATPVGSASNDDPATVCPVRRRVHRRVWLRLVHDRESRDPHATASAGLALRRPPAGPADCTEGATASSGISLSGGDSAIDLRPHSRPCGCRRRRRRRQMRPRGAHEAHDRR